VLSELNRWKGRRRAEFERKLSFPDLVRTHLEATCDNNPVQAAEKSHGMEYESGAGLTPAVKPLHNRAKSPHAHFPDRVVAICAINLQPGMVTMQQVQILLPKRVRKIGNGEHLSLTLRGRQW
jgi:hypothetical protein